MRDLKTVLPADYAAGRFIGRALSPFDLQCVKACGVTFAVSAVERVIEERARSQDFGGGLSGDA